jgi:hypothetical protein
MQEGYISRIGGTMRWCGFCHRRRRTWERKRIAEPGVGLGIWDVGSC